MIGLHKNTKGGIQRRHVHNPGVMSCEGCLLRDWSLITGRGGGYKTGGGGGKSSFTPTKRGGGGKGFSHAEGGHNKF